MPRSTFTEAHEILVDELVRLRRERGVSQVELARRLGKRQQFISLIERGDRRIDVIEVCAIVRALGADPVAFLVQLFDRIPDPVSI